MCAVVLSRRTINEELGGQVRTEGIDESKLADVNLGSQYSSCHVASRRVASKEAVSDAKRRDWRSEPDTGILERGDSPLAVIYSITNLLF